MRRLDGLESLPVSLPSCVVTIGTFDGVHVGHRRVLVETVSWARERSGAAAVVTFEDRPRAILDRRRPRFVTSLPHRLMLFEQIGVDLCLVLRFTPELAAMTALDFTRKILVEGLSARGIVMGYGSAFGRDREGTEQYIRAHSTGLGIEVRGVPPVIVEGEAVSSTRVREAVLLGDLDLAATLLGRPFTVFGTVVHGDARGRELGFPTANLDIHHEIIPPDGVYLVEAIVAQTFMSADMAGRNACPTMDGRALPALASIGTQPTFAHLHQGERPRRFVEIYIIDFDRQIYGRDLDVRFLDMLRPQKTFATVEGLISRMNDDLRLAREYFETPPGARKKPPQEP
jgi:riboflavin kinase/FMN adenylyltransferase